MYPRQVVLVTAAYKGKSNVCAVESAMPAGLKPAFICIALAKSSFTLEIIGRSGEFVVAAVGEEFRDAVRLAGSVSGTVVDKFSEGKIEAERGISVAAPIIKGAIANFECRAVGIADCGAYSLVTGEVLRADFEQDAAVKAPLFSDGQGGLFLVERQEKKEIGGGPDEGLRAAGKQSGQEKKDAGGNPGGEEKAAGKPGLQEKKGAVGDGE